MKKIISAILAVILTLGAALTLSACGNDDLVYVEMKVKDYGTIVLELDKQAAPITVDNFVKLVKDGFYDGLTFHRVVEGFMIQGGDPNANGSGGSETKIHGEFYANGYDNPIAHVRGTISMARRGDSYDSASSQFFIVNETSEDNSMALDGQYAAFGRVVEGMDVVDAITASTADYTHPYSGLILVESLKPVIEYARVIKNYKG